MYKVQCRLDGTWIEKANTIDEAVRIILDFEAEDKRENCFEENFYEIMDEDTCEIIDWYINDNSEIKIIKQNT